MPKKCPNIYKKGHIIIFKKGCSEEIFIYFCNDLS